MGVIVITTLVSVPKSIDDLSFAWEGDDTAQISFELLAFDPYGMMSNHNPMPGDIFTCGPFTVRCTGRATGHIEVVRCDS